MKQLKFIHITKNGGTSIEYCAMKHNEKFGKFHTEYSAPQFESNAKHHTFFPLIHNKIKEKYDWFMVVRNPYDRIISELLFRGIINHETILNQDFVCSKLKKYFQSFDNFDNHKLPQYLFLIDESGDLVQNLVILRTESLTPDMQRLGYIDFNHHFQVSNCKIPLGKTRYSRALNRDSIKMINEYYKRDFELFDYEYL